MKTLTTIILFIILLFMCLSAEIRCEQLQERVRVLKSIVYLLEEVPVKHTPVVRITKGE